MTQILNPGHRNGGCRRDSLPHNAGARYSSFPCLFAGASFTNNQIRTVNQPAQLWQIPIFESNRRYGQL